MNLVMKYFLLALDQFFSKLAISDAAFKRPAFDIKFEKPGLTFSKPVVAQGVNALCNLLSIDKKTFGLGWKGRVCACHNVDIHYQTHQQQQET